MKAVAAVLVLLFGLLSSVGPAQAQADLRTRDETARLAVAVLGRVCLMNLGDMAGVLSATAPGGEFGFVEVTPEVARSLLRERKGHVRVLRRPGLGTVTVMATTDGICSVWAELAEAGAVQRHLIAMMERGGMKGGGAILPLDAREEGGVRITDSYIMPMGWYAQQLGKRFGDDGAQPLALVTTVSPPGLRPWEAVLSVSRPLKQN